MALQFACSYLNDYMQMVEETESPRIFHVWAAISAVSAALGRRCWFSLGHTLVYPNQYVVIVGTPSSRKSSAMKIAKRLVKKHTSVRLAPDDMSGNRQGLISKMKDSGKKPPMYLEGSEVHARDGTLAGATLSQLASITDIPPEEMEEQIQIAAADEQTLFATSDEFSRFIGENASQLLEFLTSCWDGEPYEYSLKSESIELEKPLLNILGCTTSRALARSLPNGAGDEGILSRIILVYGARKHKMIPDPPPLDPILYERVAETLAEINTTLHGAFTMTPQAREYMNELYYYNLQVVDNRFTYYAQRRYAHLQKVSMALAATRISMLIEKSDVYEAHRILQATEIGMPSALGEYGLHPLASLKQKLLEFVREVAVMELEELSGHFQRDCRPAEFMEVVMDLVKSKLLVVQQNQQGRSYVSALGGKFPTDDTIISALTQA